MGDFNPGFTFDTGDAGGASQPAWEFAGALRQARAEGPVHGTSIDHKISQRLSKGANGRQEAPQGKQRPQAHAQNGKGGGADGARRAGAKRARHEVEEQEDSSDADEEDDDEEDEEEDDAPLPGELDSEGSDDAAEEGDDSGSEGADDEGEGNEDEEEAAAAVRVESGRHASSAGRGGAAAAAPGNGAAKPAGTRQPEPASEEPDEDEEGSDDDSGMDEEEEEQEEGEPARQAGAGARQKQAAQRQEGTRQAGGAKGAKGAKGGFYSETPEGTKFSSSSFADLNLSRPLLRAVDALGFKAPTPIQAACIPIALAGRDICGSAVTGSGKTAAFALPFLERLLHRPRGLAATYVVVLTPTRELAVQIHSMVEKLAQFTDVTVALIVGGLSLAVQAATLRKLPEVVVATPGRLLDHLRNSQSVGLEDLAVLVLDEADRLLEMGFREEVSEVVRCAPRKRQTMLFSATFTEQVKDLAALSLKQPVRLAADAALTAPKLLTQEIVRLKGPAAAATKEAVCVALCSRSFSGGRTIVFCRTKQRAHRLKILFGLAKLPPAAELHGNMSQTARLESLESFRRGDTAFLLATDVAARGLDIQGVEVVVNFDAPSKLETYLHRIGRTARAGAAGVSVTMVEDGDRHLLKELAKKTGAVLRQRMVPPAAVTQWQGRIERMEPDVAAIMAEEREEADLRKAEMEANKAANMLEHEDEIMARPKRTWFVSEREKKELQRKSAAVAAGRGVADDDDDDGGDEGDGAAEEGAGKGGKLSKAERRAARKAEAAKDTRDKKAGKRKSKQDPEAQAAALKARSIKARARMLQQEQGITAIKAAKLAAQQITGLKTSTKKSKGKNKRQKTASEKADGDGGGNDSGGLFAGDGLNTSRPGKLSASAGSGGKGDDGPRSVGRFGGKLRSQLSKTELNSLKRGGKGKASFKSKARFKRKRR